MKQILGIDVGGSKISAGWVDNSLKVSKVLQVPTSQTDLLGQLVRLIGGFQGFDAIGLGVPGDVASNGIVQRLPNIRNFKPINLKQHLEKKFQVPVHVQNDAESFAFAEAKAGQGRKFKKVFGVILGTGIGGGLVQGETHKNVDQILHSKLPGLEARMQNFGPTVKAAQYQRLVEKLLTVILKSFHPEIVIFGGGRSHIKGMQKVLESSWPAMSSKKGSVKVSKLKHAGIIGAALPLLKR